MGLLFDSDEEDDLNEIDRELLGSRDFKVRDALKTYEKDKREQQKETLRERRAKMEYEKIKNMVGKKGKPPPMTESLTDNEYFIRKTIADNKANIRREKRERAKRISEDADRSYERLVKNVRRPFDMLADAGDAIIGGVGELAEDMSKQPSFNELLDKKAKKTRAIEEERAKIKKARDKQNQDYIKRREQSLKEARKRNAENMAMLGDILKKPIELLASASEAVISGVGSAGEIIKDTTEDIVEVIQDKEAEYTARREKIFQERIDEYDSAMREVIRAEINEELQEGATYSERLEEIKAFTANPLRSNTDDPSFFDSVGKSILFYIIIPYGIIRIISNSGVIVQKKV